MHKHLLSPAFATYTVLLVNNVIKAAAPPTTSFVDKSNDKNDFTILLHAYVSVY